MSDKNTNNQEFENESFEESADKNELNENSEIEALENQLAKEKEQYLRLFAEFDNFKKRTSKERLDIFKTANSETITALLPVLDDFERAIKEIEKSADEETLKGILLIQNKLIETLRGKGLKEIEVLQGDEFDTDKHEAITQIPAPSEELKGKIIEVIQTGYTLNDKVIRYAKVIVANR